MTLFNGFDIDDYEMDDPEYYMDAEDLECNRCGSPDVHWVQEDSGQWVLYTDGEPHVCEDVVNDWE